MYVLHALGLVVDRELAAGLDDHRRGIELHRVVMLDWNEILGLVAHGGRSQRLVGRAAHLRRREHGLQWICRNLDPNGRLAPAAYVGDVCFPVVFHLNQGRGKSRDLPRFRYHQRDRLAVEHDLAVVERSIRGAFRRHVVLVGLVVVRQGRTVFMREDVEHALDAQRLAGVDAGYAALWDGRSDHIAVDKAGRIEFARILGLARDLGATVNARCRCADVRCHSRAPSIFRRNSGCGASHVRCVDATAPTDRSDCGRAGQDAAPADVAHHGALTGSSCWTAIAACLARLAAARGRWCAAPGRS